MHKRIFENSMGWNSSLPTWTQSRALLIGLKNSGATSRMPAARSSR